MTPSDVDAGWAAVHAAVVILRGEITAAAPDAATAAEGEAYLMRVLATCLSDAFLGHVMSEGGLLRALPTRGGPNPDYRMLFAAIDPARSYRLEGWLNGSERVGVGLYSFEPGGAADIAAYRAVDAATVDATGRFALQVAADAAGPGTLAIPPAARTILIRVLHRNAAAAPARLVLSGGDPVCDLGLAQGSTSAALRQVAQAMTASIRSFLEWTAVTSAACNAFHQHTPAMTQGVQGDPDTRYFLGSYQLTEGEWLELRMPAGIPGYWSLHAYNHWCEPLPGAGIGDTTGVPDADGSIPIALGPTAWGTAANRIDTRGRRRGALICRLIGARGVAAPLTRLHRPADAGTGTRT